MEDYAVHFPFSKEGISKKRGVSPKISEKNPICAVSFRKLKSDIRNVNIKH